MQRLFEIKINCDFSVKLYKKSLPSEKSGKKKKNKRTSIGGSFFW